MNSKHVWWMDFDTGFRLVISQPKLDRQLWAKYVDGACINYKRYGVEHALDQTALASGDDTAMFFAAIDRPDGNVVAGLRAIGPLTCAEDSHALAEWEGQQDRASVYKLITNRIPYGVLEMKTAWVSDQHPYHHELVDAIARSGWHIATLIGAQYYIATADEQTAARWCSAGGTIANVAAVPYPDYRFRSRLILWDRQTALKFAQPHQASKMRAEAKVISERIKQ